MNASLPDPSPVTSPDLWMLLMKTGLAVIVVLALLVGVLWLLKRMVHQRGGLAGRGMIRILTAYPVSPKGRIMLIEVMGQKMLIGVTAQSVNFLTRIEAEDLPVSNDVPEVPSFFEKLFRGHQ